MGEHLKPQHHAINLSLIEAYLGSVDPVLQYIHIESITPCLCESYLMTFLLLLVSLVMWNLPLTMAHYNSLSCPSISPSSLEVGSRRYTAK
jgi:hypothetical protein